MTITGSSAPGPADLWPGAPEAAPGVAAVDIPVRLGPAAAGRCRRRVHLDADPTAARSARSAPDDGVQLRLADGALHRDKVLKVLRTVFPDVRVWKVGDDDRPAAVFAPS